MTTYAQSVQKHGDNWRIAAPLIDVKSLLQQELREYNEYNLMRHESMRFAAMAISERE